MASSKKAAGKPVASEKPKRKYTRRVPVNAVRVRRWSVSELEAENARLEQKIRTLEGVILLIHRAA
jgi:hypothetical protein